MKKYNVNFINQNISILADEGVTLAEICHEAGFSMDLVCGGKGTCGKCKIEIEINNERSVELACQTKINSDVDIYLTENYKEKSNILSSIADVAYNFNPSLKKIYKDTITIQNECSDQFLRNCNLNVLRAFSELINNKEINGITFVLYENEIIDVQANDTTKSLFGASVDIGTTTVVLYVYDLNEGNLINAYSDLNSQISVGADIVSRINYADNSKGLEDLNGKIILTLNKLVQRAEIDISNLKENLYNIILCGNSTMQHLFLALRPDRLGVSPFTSITRDFVECFGKETNLKCPDRCKILFLPLLGGFVGSDTTSVLLTIDDEEKNRLIIDLGTNGEIAVGNINNYYVASTACGPALEGGSIECGMRGTEGAIEKVRIEKDDVILKVIGDLEPSGICGSGIIDITAELIKQNIIDKTGRMLTYDECKQMKPYSKLSERLVEINGVNSFILYKENNKMVYINQKDVRQIQLAKSAIYSGCMALLNAYETDIKRIDEIIVSGAFGNYIDVNNAVYIGLLPNEINKIKAIGNGAGKGVSMFLLDRCIREKCGKVVNNSKHYELANDNNFILGYINNMNFM